MFSEVRATLNRILIYVKFETVSSGYVMVQKDSS